MSAASLDAEVIRTEFDSAIERVVERLTALESSVSQLTRPGTRDDGHTAEPSSEVVTQNEFRLFKWLGSFSLAAMLAGFGFLYQQIADLRVDVERQFADLRVDVERQFADLRVDIERQHRDLLQEMNARYVDIRGEIGLLRERVTGVETRAPT
ncbi:MAG: hypothetical protein OXI79_20745 [Gammaproteobacteria bacterium]|nr:hypothetical protein [Gammaproteobacteria bacterium]